MPSARAHARRPEAPRSTRGAAEMPRGIQTDAAASKVPRSELPPVKRTLAQKSRRRQRMRDFYRVSRRGARARRRHRHLDFRIVYLMTRRSSLVSGTTSRSLSKKAKRDFGHCFAPPQPKHLAPPGIKTGSTNPHASAMRGQRSAPHEHRSALPPWRARRPEARRRIPSCGISLLTCVAAQAPISSTGSASPSSSKLTRTSPRYPSCRSPWTIS